MAETQTQTQPMSMPMPTPISMPLATQAMTIPPSSIALPANSAAKFRNQLALDTFSSPVNQNGSFEFDRVLKSGYVQRRTKTKVGPRLSHGSGDPVESQSLTSPRRGNGYTWSSARIPSPSTRVIRRTNCDTRSTCRS